MMGPPKAAVVEKIPPSNDNLKATANIMMKLPKKQDEVK